MEIFFVIFCTWRVAVRKSLEYGCVDGCLSPAAQHGPLVHGDGFLCGKCKYFSYKRCTTNASVGQYNCFGHYRKNIPSHSLKSVKDIWWFYMLMLQARKMGIVLLCRQQRGIHGNIFCDFFFFYMEGGGENEGRLLLPPLLTVATSPSNTFPSC